MWLLDTYILNQNFLYENDNYQEPFFRNCKESVQYTTERKQVLLSLKLNDVGWDYFKQWKQ